MKKTIYVSGKITGTDDYMKRFADAESRLKLQGWRVMNPAKKNAHFDPKNTSWEDYMRASIRLLSRADAIYLLRGWRQSKGAILEHSIAVALGMTIISQEKGE